MTRWKNDKLMRCQVDEMSGWWKQRVDKMTFQWNDELAKWHIDKMIHWWNDTLTK